MGELSFRRFREISRISLLNVISTQTEDQHWVVWLTVHNPLNGRDEKIILAQDDPAAVYEYDNRLTVETAELYGITMRMSAMELARAYNRGHLTSSDIYNPAINAIAEETEYALEEIADNEAIEFLSRTSPPFTIDAPYTEDTTELQDQKVEDTKL